MQSAGYLSKDEALLTAEQFTELQMGDICQSWGVLGIPKPGGA